MRQINLREHERSEPYQLSAAERDTLLSLTTRETGGASLPLTIEPVMGAEGSYCLTPGSTVGAVEVEGLSLLIQPKIGIPQLLSLACYAMDVFRLRQDRLFNFEEQEALPDTLALALAAAARRAFVRGLLHGYRTEEEALHTVRGRIRFDEQMRRRSGVPLPVEVRYDEFTDDILENRLVKAAVVSLGGMRLRSPAAQQGLGRVAGILDNVRTVEYPPGEVPPVRFDRLNEHYRGVVGLSRLILRHSAFESGRGPLRAAGFLMDMNVVFQEFVTQALREALGISERAFLERSIPSLDEEGQVHLRPDLTWWDSGVCRFVGDAKYKNVTSKSEPNSDLYQLLAYVTALGLPGGLVIYAQGEPDKAVHRVRRSGKSLEVAALDLSGPLDHVLNRVESLAARVRALRDEALVMSLAA